MTLRQLKEIIADLERDGVSLDIEVKYDAGLARHGEFDFYSVKNDDDGYALVFSE